ncbi:NRDE family protein [Saccharothrix sp. ST-888]|uniref:NRDE family protein n=1 Tax=Saccharothrix sp. ST-888 TaxID=1427391 RepID=UPI0005ED1638|nr:NRDE family protein [Saccharothrix sp. ST-888]
MCTAFVSIDPGSPTPVVVLSVRDEYAGRDWLPPDRYWPSRPALVGGQDLLAGGSWLALNPGSAGEPPRMACLLNGFGPAADPTVRLSRGDLPLMAVADGGLDLLDPERYDPFHLVCAQAGEVRVLSWSGHELVERLLPPGLHVVVNDGLEGRAANRTASERAGGMMAARVAHFRPRLAAAARPEPTVSPTGAPTGEAWGQWLPIAAGDGLDLDDPAALIQRRDFGDGRIWGSTSVSLVALGPAEARYDFNSVPGSGAWHRVGLDPRTPSTEPAEVLTA